MTSPLKTLFTLNAVTEDLDMIQTWIDQTRVRAANDQYVQRELDRQQIMLDVRRAQIESAKFRIASSN